MGGQIVLTASAAFGRSTVPRPDHVEQPRHICGAAVARDVILLVGTFVLCSSEYMGFQSPSAYQPCIRFAAGRKFHGCSLNIDRITSHCGIRRRRGRDGDHGTKAQRQLRLRQVFKRKWLD